MWTCHALPTATSRSNTAEAFLFGFSMCSIEEQSDEVLAGIVDEHGANDAVV